ncbi:hypothetical protein EJB05_08369 [Eragrostis curvula]|uniref:FBD domain-containing protein n=1 Tax=Eragrostis curvula TaxID=38414 RepID=A0A5J9W0N4_9POAL|nr:hypothetical protein EJB05_08369 [Eragrostis curvula]
MLAADLIFLGGYHRRGRSFPGEALSGGREMPSCWGQNLLEDQDWQGTQAANVGMLGAVTARAGDWQHRHRDHTEFLVFPGASALGNGHLASPLVPLDASKKVKTVPSILKCFPNIETLHIYSMKVNGPTGNVKLKFWQDACPIECVEWHVKKFVIHEFQGNKSELTFIKFIAERVQALEKMVIIYCHEDFSSVDDVNAKLNSLVTGKWASKNVQLGVSMQRGPAFWSVRGRGVTDGSYDDPMFHYH